MKTLTDAQIGNALRELVWAEMDIFSLQCDIVAEAVKRLKKNGKI